MFIIYGPSYFLEVNKRVLFNEYKILILTCENNNSCDLLFQIMLF